tara:strand:- start:326 stop:586 length:261 start_codon:yes stop_codon:yes gene_type:complete
MSWQSIVKEKGDCAVEICKANTCRSNENMHCILDVITISPTGQCEMFEKKEQTQVRAKTRGDMSFIDRATQNLRDEQAERKLYSNR